jgi:thymidylate kinase
LEGVVFVAEPVDEWMQSGLLQAMYSGALNTSTFQHMVLMSLAADLGRVILLQQPSLIITERSPVSNYYVFAKENLSGVELDAYKFVWDRFMGVSPPGLESHYVYLDADANTLDARMRDRNRPSEDTVSKEYMQALEKRHKAWLAEETNAHTVDASGSGDEVLEAVLSKLKSVLAASSRAPELQCVIDAL